MMEKIELQEIIDACEESGSDYLRLYRPLLGYEDEVSFYRGIDDSMEPVLDEMEAKLGLALPADFLQVYLIANGGKYFDINLYYLSSDKKDENGLYYKNITSDLREMYDIPEGMVIVGEYGEDALVLLGVDEDGYYFYCTWDKKERVIDVEYGFLVELLMYEVDYHTEAFSTEIEE